MFFTHLNLSAAEEVVVREGKLKIEHCRFKVIQDHMSKI